ncbi:alpha/beta hydrolase [Frankia sp. Mgl5]|nr:alpha/beta hydrolase [Frankia sp. Mgl5]
MRARTNGRAPEVRAVGARGAVNEVLVVGDGEPVVLVAHAWGASARVMLPTVAGVPGTLVAVNFRGYGGSSPRPNGWTYADLAEELAGVARAVGASAAVGQSMGAGALLALADGEPDLFTAMALLLPPAVDKPIPAEIHEMFRRVHVARLAGDPAELRAEIARCMSPELRDARGGAVYLRAYALMLMACSAPTERPGNAPVPDRARLARVRARTLVVGQEGDLIHRTETALALAAALPAARSHVFPATAPMWSERLALRTLLTDHLAPADTPALAGHRAVTDPPGTADPLS